MPQRETLQLSLGCFWQLHCAVISQKQEAKTEKSKTQLESVSNRILIRTKDDKNCYYAVSVCVSLLCFCLWLSLSLTHTLLHTHRHTPIHRALSIWKQTSQRLPTLTVSTYSLPLTEGHLTPHSSSKPFKLDLEVCAGIGVAVWTNPNIRQTREDSERCGGMCASY